MKKILSLVSLVMMTFIGTQAQGTFGLKNGDAGVASGTTETSVENITMTWGVTGGADFKGGNKANAALENVLDATAYCEGNGTNGSLADGVYAGTVYFFTPAVDGTLTVGIVLNAGKAFYVKEGTDGTDVAFELTDAAGAAVTLTDNKVTEKLTGGLVKFSVTANKTYAVYCTGSKLGYYGFKFEKAATPEPQPEPAAYGTIWENGEVAVDGNYSVITVPASKVNTLAKVGDQLFVNFEVAATARPARIIKDYLVELWADTEKLEEITSIPVNTPSIFFELDATMVEKIAAATNISFKYKNAIISKIEFKEGAPVVVPVEVTFNFADPNFRENIGTAMTDVKGYIYNEVFTVDGATLQITAGSAPSRVYTDASRGQCLVTYTQYSTLTFKAPEGKAITKIEFTAAGNSNINKFTASSGAIEGMVWTGNAEGVRFLQGATSYLANAIVTLVDKTDETVALAPIEYKECANIAAFNALNAGEYAKVTLTDAEVIGKSADGYSTVWIQDATGGTAIQYTSLNAKLEEKTKVNGTVYVVKRVASGAIQMKEAEATLESLLETTPLSDYSFVAGTIEEVNVPANLNKVVKITGATLEETSATAGKLTQGEVTLDVNNGNAAANQQLCKIADWAKDTKFDNVNVVGILVAKSATANQLLPISIEVVVGISEVAAQKKADVTIYNLQGVRMNKLQKGLNIVNGKKIVF